MIIRILEEMRQVRIKGDYKNYRDLTNILKDYVYNDILNTPLQRLESGKYLQKYKPLVENIIKWLDSETNLLKELLDDSLTNGDYKSLKIISHSDMMIKKIHNELTILKKRL